MRRWLPVAALGAVLLTSSAWAQRRGGGGFAAHGGVAAHPGFASRAPMGGGMGSWSRPHGWGYPRYGAYWRGYPYFGYGRYCRGCYYGPWRVYPWWGSGWISDYSYPSEANSYYEYPPDTYAQERALDQQAEIDQLNNEVARLREERQPPAAPPRAATNAREQTDLVYRDKHAEQIGNYAIVGQTLWILNEQRARKVALADLDIAATKSANEARGVEFDLPRPR